MAVASTKDELFRSDVCLVACMPLGAYHDWAADVHIQATLPHVDYLVVSEMNKTFSGDDKPFVFRHAGKPNVVYTRVVFPSLNPYANDFVQRNALTAAINAIRDENRDKLFVILILDADEFVSPQCFRCVRAWASAQTMLCVCSIPMLWFINCFSKLAPVFWTSAKILAVPQHEETVPSIAQIRWALTESEMKMLLEVPTAEDALRVLKDRHHSETMALFFDCFGYHLSAFAVRSDSVDRKLREWAHATDPTETRTRVVESQQPESRVFLWMRVGKTLVADVERVLSTMDASLRLAITSVIERDSTVFSQLNADADIVVYTQDNTFIENKISVFKVRQLSIACSESFKTKLNGIVVPCQCRKRTTVIARPCDLSTICAPYVIIEHTSDPFRLSSVLYSKQEIPAQWSTDEEGEFVHSI